MDDAWTMIEYTNATLDEETRIWTSVAEVAEIPSTAFAWMMDGCWWLKFTFTNRLEKSR